jgi:cell wall-associated NlpC family hydrolase
MPFEPNGPLRAGILRLLGFQQRSGYVFQMPFSLARPRRSAGRRSGLALVSFALSTVLCLVGGGPALAVEQNAPSPTTIQPPASGVATSPIERHKVANTDGEGLRVRKEPGLEAAIVARLPEGALVKLRDVKPVDDDGERWVAVRSQEGQGWVAARYVTRVVVPAMTVVKLPVDAPFAERVVALARSANGHPYVWGGNAPGGFDCSGFVQWVYKNAGVADMPRLIPDQKLMGASVEPSKIQAGDLLVFANTYTTGESHVGIALSPTLFQHASDESHGVTVSSLTEAYWQERFVRAVRVKSAQPAASPKP